MITPQELRIGNWIHFNGKDTIVTAIRDNELPELGYKGSVDVKFFLTDTTYTYESPWLAKCTPIPLTEEWLLKFGWKSVGELHPTFKFQNYLIEASLMWDSWVLRQIINDKESLAIAVFEYVHTLQNIYFSLKGQELTLLSETKEAV